MIKYIFKKLIKKISKKENNHSIPQKIDLKKINIGDMVRFTNTALDRQKYHQSIYGNCNNENCNCDRIFEKSFVGIVIEQVAFMLMFFGLINLKGK